MKIAAAPRSGAVAAPTLPRRHQRSRKKGSRTPDGVIYCGRPTIRGNPFDWRRFGLAYSVRLFRDWLDGRLSDLRIERLGFCPAEIEALHRRRERLLAEIGRLRGRDLQCWCPLSSRWCHIDILIERANR
jgi:Domain of unknown function (DUF4326)